MGLIVKYATDPSEIFVIEVDEQGKVSANKWSDLKTLKGTQYLKFAHRQLKWERPDEILPVIDDFLDKVIG